MTDFIIGICVVGVSLLVVMLWPVGRAILLESLFHPFRRSVIQMDEKGHVMVIPEQKEKSDGKWRRPNQEEDPPLEQEPEQAAALLHHTSGISGHRSS